ncbi:hypothetical protein CVT25_006316 [Psilocybe cyanescens]|uniref:Uncharacterized protein n=1 Tax=Psilocybe cyanescens TaxID=93625 RepID=A0A409WYN7_PSICY|nr:hypothetical protein CVT25_006316 [Psilocybe cyanescens]
MDVEPGDKGKSHDEEQDIEDNIEAFEQGEEAEMPIIGEIEAEVRPQAKSKRKKKRKSKLVQAEKPKKEKAEWYLDQSNSYIPTGTYKKILDFRILARKHEMKSDDEKSENKKSNAPAEDSKVKVPTSPKKPSE